jgi:hypothetical protein
VAEGDADCGEPAADVLVGVAAKAVGEEPGEGFVEARPPVARSVLEFMTSTVAAGRSSRIVLEARSVVDPGHPPG